MTGLCKYTAVTDLTTACSPGLVAGGCLLYDGRCQDIKAQNQIVLTRSLQEAPPGTTLWVPPGKYYVDAGVYAPLVDGINLRLEGTLYFGGAELQSHESVRDHWPNFKASKKRKACNCITIKRFNNFSITARPGYKGVIDGGGPAWYGIGATTDIGIAHIDGGLSGPKPALMNIGRESDPLKPEHSRGLLLENVWLKDSGYWTLLVRASDVIIRNFTVSARQMWKGQPP
mgnify:CR=1 FL=1